MGRPGLSREGEDGRHRAPSAVGTPGACHRSQVTGVGLPVKEILAQLSPLSFKLLQLIAKSQLTSLSGVAQKNYFNVLDKIVQKGKRATDGFHRLNLSEVWCEGRAVPSLSPSGQAVGAACPLSAGPSRRLPPGLGARGQLAGLWSCSWRRGTALCHGEKCAVCEHTREGE